MHIKEAQLISRRRKYTKQKLRKIYAKGALAYIEKSKKLGHEIEAREKN